MSCGLSTSKHATYDIDQIIAEFRENSTVIYAAPWGVAGNPGTPELPVGPTMNAILPLADAIGGNVVVVMAPGSYNYTYSATALLDAPNTKCFLQGVPGLVTIRFDGDSALAVDVTPVNIAGAYGVHFDGVWEAPSSTLVNGPALIRDSGFSAAGVAPVFLQCRFDVYQVDEDGVSRIYDCSYSGATMNETVLQGQKINVEAAEIRGLVYSPRASITVENAGATLTVSGAATGIVIRQTTEDDIVTISGRIIEDNVVTGAQNITTSGYESLQRNRFISTGTNGAEFFNPLTGAHAVCSRNYMSVADVGSSHPWALTGADSPLSFTAENNTFVYTGTWAELSTGTPALFIRYDNEFPVYIRGNSFGTYENPLTVIPILDGFWNASVDPGQPTDDRFMEIARNAFYVTYANTASPPEDPAVGIGYLMSRSDSGKLTYDIHDNVVHFDSSATQSTDRLHAALVELRGAGSGGTNGSGTAATGNTWANIYNNQVVAKFPSGTITNGGKSLVYVRNSPIFSEQATMLTPLLGLGSLIYDSDGNHNNHLRGSSSTALNNTTLGLMAGDTAFDVQTSVGTPARQILDAGDVIIRGMRMKVKSVSSNYTITNQDGVIACDVSGGDIEITLPASPGEGQAHVIRHDAGDITIFPIYISGTLDGAVDPSLTVAHDCRTILYTTAGGWKSLDAKF